jgi:hypothetical protein
MLALPVVLPETFTHLSLTPTLPVGIPPRKGEGGRALIWLNKPQRRERPAKRLLL